MGEKEGKRRRRKREERLEGKPKRRGDHWTRRRETSWESLLLILAMIDESAGTIASTDRSRDASQETRNGGGGTRRRLDGTARRLVVGTQGGFYGR